MGRGWCRARAAAAERRLRPNELDDEHDGDDRGSRFDDEHHDLRGAAAHQQAADLAAVGRRRGVRRGSGIARQAYHIDSADPVLC